MKGRDGGACPCPRGKDGGMKTVKIFWVMITVIVAVIFSTAWLLAWDRSLGQKESMEGRIELLERKIEEKFRPMIMVNRATIYNSDGEIVIEEAEGRRN